MHAEKLPAARGMSYAEFMRLSPAECRLLNILTIYAEQRELGQVIAAPLHPPAVS